jgi:hypothetical protein
LVGPGATGTPPPRKLGAAGQALWDAVTSEYEIRDAGGVEILAQAAQASDRVEALAEQISVDGPIVHTRSGPKAHPALRDELHGRAFRPHDRKIVTALVRGGSLTALVGSAFAA